MAEEGQWIEIGLMHQEVTVEVDIVVAVAEVKEDTMVEVESPSSITTSSTTRFTMIEWLIGLKSSTKHLLHCLSRSLSKNTI